MTSAETITVANSADLKSVFGTIADGGRIELLPGAYDRVRLRDRDFADGITITAQDPDDRPVFTDTLWLQGVAGITLQGIDITAEALASNGSASHFNIVGSRDITVTDVDITGHIPTASEGLDPYAGSASRLDPIAGYGYGNAAWIRWSDDITIADMEIKDVRVALTMEDVTGAALTGLDIHKVREGVNIHDVTGLTIAQSQFHHFEPWRQGERDHADMIQYWHSKNDSNGVNDLVIRDNVFYQPDMLQSQSIFGNGKAFEAGEMHENITIADNLIVNAHPNGVRLDKLDGFTVTGNTLLSGDAEAGRGEHPKIVLRDVANGTVSDNIVIDTWSAPAVMKDTKNVAVTGNTILSNDPNAADYWGLTLEAVADQLPADAGAGDAGAGAKRDTGDGGTANDTSDGGTAGDTSDGSTANDTGDGGSADETGTAHLESGSLTVGQDHADQWHSVAFAEAIPEARVVMGPLSFAGSDPATVRVRNVTETGFEFQIDEWDYLDGWHAAETVSWIAGSAGTYTLASGQTVAFGRAQAEDDTPVAVALSGFEAAPAVFAQVTSANGSQAVTDRIDAVGASGFTMRMQEEEANDQRHLRETLDWMAIDYATGGAVEARLAGGVTDAVADLGVEAPADDFVFIADMQTGNGSDTAAIRTTARGPDGVSLFVEEEGSADAETGHVGEAVAHLALAEGSYDLFA